ncbi:MAG: magnesium transporter [Candidatus Bathyarchaeia archaeon]
MPMETVQRLSVKGALAGHLSLMGQSFLAFTFNIGGILSGLMFAIFFSKFQDPILLMLLPAILTLRGNINGILSSKLGTLLHTGRILPSLRGNTRDFEELLRSTFTLTFQSTLLIGLIAFTANLFLGRIDPTYLPLFIFIPTLTGGVSVTISEAITSALAMFTFKRGLDPDILTYPLMSTVNDVTVTFIYFGISWLMLTWTHSMLFGVVLFLAIGVTSTIFTALYRRGAMFKRTVMEATPAILASLSLGVLNGIILSGFKSEIEENPAVLTVYPALMDSLGDIGAITGATTTTKLFLGELKAKVSTIKGALKGLIPVESMAFLLHIAYGWIGFILSREAGLTIPFTRILGITLASNLITFPAIFTVAYLTAIMTFKKGLDPDNFVIPLETSIADSLATLSVSTLTRLLKG